MSEHEPTSPPSSDPAALRQDLMAEYQAILKIVSEFDGRIMIVKGWSVTLSLAGLALAFQTQHWALFALASATALGFWYMETMIKRHQMRYYPRMREIEVAAYELNRVPIEDGSSVSSPKIDWKWGYTGRGAEYPDAPTRRSPADLRRLLRRAPWMAHVLVPHAIAVVLGVLLCVLVLTGAPGFEGFTL
ncbi:MAG TPA: hypothetical protein VFY91_10945 [Microbacterium sp.]|nr:hypothetical protein [Microbacterium sp.]